MNRCSTRPEASPLELWGGIECTVNRVQERYFDQIAWSGHHARIADLDAIAALGIRTLRYPVLWERVAPDGLARADWAWTDERLERLRELGIRPIATLVHHGSGPAHTHLLDPGFAAGLAEFARAVAERYPWIDAYTPVNEPLTTARFSALYGYWYPHCRDSASMMRALLMEIAATRLAMRAIREVRPDAQLVQTEDIGKVHATPRLRYQAEFENERRWLSLDLLYGRVDARHPMMGFLRYAGIEERELASLAGEPCPPDLIGVNYYATSERYLDERLERYPPSSHGGNGRDRYADVEALRCEECDVRGFEGILRETAARYPAPLAITEAHLGGTREEQMRWLAGAWEAAERVRADGIDVRAVTAWALLGSHNWHSLVTRDDGHYEAGAFDVRSGHPRLTALGRLARSLATGEQWSHAALDAPGWWERDDRLLYGVREMPGRGWVGRRAGRAIALAGPGEATRPIAGACRRRHLRWRAWPGVNGAEPWAVVLCAPRPGGPLLRALRESPAGVTVMVITAGDGADDAARELCGRGAVITLPAGESTEEFEPRVRSYADQALDLLIDGARGVWRATGDGLLVEIAAADPAGQCERAGIMGEPAAAARQALDGSGAFR